MHHATMHHPITAGHTQHTSKALEALHKQRDKKQAEAEAARRKEFLADARSSTSGAIVTP